MPYDPNKHRRRSIRLKGYDYSQAGAYFVTIVTQGRECRFGEIINGAMQPNEAGQIVETAWTSLPQRFPNIELDACVIMPNHLHGIVVVGATLVAAQDASGANYRAGINPAPTNDSIRAKTNPAPTLGHVVGAFKSITTHAYIQGVYDCGWSPFDKRVWQRNYYEHIIRSEIELNAIRKYIVDNPARWEQDRDNPIHLRPAAETVAAYLSEAGL